MLNGGPINTDPLNAPESGDVFVDWSLDVDPITSRTYYALEVDDGILPAIRIPISSWQATQQLGRASFTQAVIPAAIQWVAPVADRENADFVIYRGVRLENGDTQEAELARAPLEIVRFDRGPTNATMTISGYATLPPPQAVLTRTLQNVRSISASPDVRVRCDIDFFLRPGHQVIADGSQFQASYINYYANSSDEYMDVGERTNG